MTPPQSPSLHSHPRAGDIYSGQWLNGKKDGAGVYMYKDTGAKLVRLPAPPVGTTKQSLPLPLHFPLSLPGTRTPGPSSCAHRLSSISMHLSGDHGKLLSMPLPHGITSLPNLRTTHPARLPHTPPRMSQPESSKYAKIGHPPASSRSSWPATPCACLVAWLCCRPSFLPAPQDGTWSAGAPISGSFTDSYGGCYTGAFAGAAAQPAYAAGGRFVTPAGAAVVLAA
jgi:hypothetical protein